MHGWDDRGNTVGIKKPRTPEKQQLDIFRYQYPENLREMELTRPELFDFHGVAMTHNFTDNWENVQKFQARPDDILLATYPKSGNTWISYMVDLLYFGQTNPNRDTTVPLYLRIPTLEVSITSFADESRPVNYTGIGMINRVPTSPRLIKTHLPIQFVPKSFWEQNCRIIYVGRNAKDVVVSYFHMENKVMMHPEPGDWNSYVQRFMEGKMLFGSWYDHVSGWWKKKQTYSKLHYMFYEDAIENTEREMAKLCSFLGLSPSAEETDSILRKVQFDNMKNNNLVNFSQINKLHFSVSSFCRKGKVGDWKNHFTVAQSEEFDEDYEKKMKDSTLQFRSVM